MVLDTVNPDLFVVQIARAELKKLLDENRDLRHQSEARLGLLEELTTDAERCADQNEQLRAERARLTARPAYVYLLDTALSRDKMADLRAGFEAAQKQRSVIVSGEWEIRRRTVAESLHYLAGKLQEEPLPLTVLAASFAISMLVEDVRQVESGLAEAVRLLRRLADDQDCRLEHGGACQAHMLDDPDCAITGARTLIAQWDADHPQPEPPQEQPC